MPVHCPICRPNSSGKVKTFWKYNAMYHFVMEHAENNEELPPIPPSSLVETFITSQEESVMGVKKEVTSDWRKQYDIPGTKGVLGFESPTRGWVGRSAGGCQKKNMEPLIKLS